MTSLYLIRHGETEWNLERRMQGHADSQLSALGVRQAEWLAESLRDLQIDVFLSSSSGRTLQTARIVKGNREISITASDAWREMNLGAWEGLLTDDIQRKYPEEMDAFWNAPHQYMASSGGESYDALQSRVLPALEQVLVEHHGKTIVMISHTVTLKVIMAHFEGRALSELWNPPYFYPTCLNLIEWQDGKPHIRLHGDISHFQDREATGY